MKKTLALLLALLMLTSLVFVACTDNEGTPVNDDEYEDDDNIKDNEDEDNDTEANTDTETETETETEKQTENTVDAWETKNDTVYTGMNNVNLRKEPSKNASTLKQAATYGTALTRVSTNNIWSKVTYEGGTYYVLNAMISEDANDFQFEAVATPSTLTIKEDYQVCFYETPFESTGEHAYNNVLKASGVKPEYISEGSTLKKVAMSKNGNWMKVEFIGTINFVNVTVEYTAENPGTFYIPDYQVTKGRVIDSDRPSSGSQGGASGNG